MYTRFVFQTRVELISIQMLHTSFWLAVIILLFLFYYVRHQICLMLLTLPLVFTFCLLD